MKRIVPILLALLSVPAVQAAPFAGADAQAGAALHAKQCAGCHVGRFGGDGSKIYTRPDHRVKSASALEQQITTCTTNLGLDLFPEDENNLGAYLNQHYYKFK